MQTIEAPTRLRVAYWCHLPPVDIALPFIPVDRDLFSATDESFCHFTTATSVGWFGAKFALVDISGLTGKEVRERMKAEQGSRHTVDRVRFLQCLQYLHEQKKGGTEVPEFRRIVAYFQADDWPVGAVPNERGFSRIGDLDPETPWEPGTLGVFCIDTL